jgi:hypothetical protein
MGLSNLAFSATNINAGNDADKPPATVGGLYIATDTNMVYVCYVDGEWENINPTISTLNSDYSKLLQRYVNGTSTMAMDTSVKILDPDSDYTNYDWEICGQIECSDIVFNGDDVRFEIDAYVKRNSDSCYVDYEIRSPDDVVYGGGRVNYHTDWQHITIDIPGIEGADLTFVLWGKASNWYDGYTNKRQLKNFELAGSVETNNVTPSFTTL